MKRKARGQATPLERADGPLRHQWRKTQVKAVPADKSLRVRARILKGNPKGMDVAECGPTATVQLEGREEWGNTQIEPNAGAPVR